MKICFFTEIYHKGGLDTFLINIFNSWNRESDSIHLICNKTHPGLKNIINKTRKNIILETYSRLFTSRIYTNQSLNNSLESYLRGFLKFIFRLVEYPIIFPWYVFSLMLFFVRNDYDRLIVVNGGYPASLLCRCAVIAWSFSFKSKPAIMNFHNSVKASPTIRKPFENIIDFFVEKYSYKIVSVSENCMNSIRSRKPFKQSKKLTFIYNGIEDPNYTNVQDIDEVKNPENYCLMLATYEKRKGHIFLLNAFKEVVKEHKNIQLRIHGYGSIDDVNRVSNKVKDLNLERNVFLGEHVQDIKNLYLNASMLVVPSQEYESFGLTIIEAMAFGIPVVTTDVGGMPEVMGKTKAGFVCSKDNYLEFANAMKSILNDAKMSKKMSNNGRKAFKSNFIAKKMTQKYINLII